MPNIITNRFKELDWRRNGMRPFLGHKYGKEGDIAHDFRCPICGVWLSYSYKEVEKFVKENRWDFAKNRLAHCGNSMCEEYYRRMKVHQKRVAEEMKEHYLSMFTKLKRKGVVA